jgi:HEAT repeat protein
MVVGGIALGIILFLLRRTLSPATCKRCGILKREFFLSAAIVSSLLSYMALCASSVMAKEKDGPTVQEASPTTVTHLQALKQSKEWQDLKVLWNLITGDLEFLQDDSDDGSMRMSDGLPRWKASLLLAVVDHRIKQLDRLVNQGVLSVDTSQAITSLFHDMLSHVARSNSNATCYMPSAEGGQWRSAIYNLESQMKEIKKLSKAGTLNESVIATIEKQLKEKLTVLEILGERPISKITEEEMEARIQQWRKQGKIKARWVDGSIRRQISEEIVKERQSKLSSDERARRQAAWQQDQQTVLDLAVDLGRYVPNRAAEKEIIKEFYGNMAQTRLVECLKTANSYEKAELIKGLGEIGGADVVPILKEQLNDKTLQCFSRSSSANIDPDAMTGYVAYSIHDQAVEALKALGVEAPEKSERKAESPEARSMVKETLASKDPKVIESGIRAVSHTKDKSFIPILKAILAKHPSLRVETLEVLGELGDASSLPLLMSAAEEGADPQAICSALGDIGTKEALDYLQKLVSVSKDPSMRRIAIGYLSEKKEAAFTTPVFKEALKDGQLAVRLQAASALQQLDCHDGFSVLVEASKSSDDELREEAMRGLSQSKDPRAAAYLKTSAQPSDGEGQHQARLALIDKGGPDALKALEDVLKEPGSEDKAQALLWIGRAEAEVPGLETFLINTLTNGDAEIRRAAISALRDKGTTNAIPALLMCQQAHKDDLLLTYEVPIAMKAIRQRSHDQQLGSFLTDLTSADPAKRQEAEKRKNKLSDEDIQALVAVLGDYGKPDQERKDAKKLLEGLGARCIGPIIQSLSEMDSSDMHVNWTVMEILDAHMEEAIPQLMAFISDTSKYGRENVIAVFEGGMPRRKQYPLKKIAGLQELLTKCSSDKNDKVRAAARSLLLKMDRSSDASLNTALTGLSDPSWNVHFQTLLSIKYSTFNPEQKTKIAQALASLLTAKLNVPSEYSNTQYVLDAMEVFPDRSAIPVLQKMIKAGKPEEERTPRFASSRDDYTPVQLAAKLLYSLSDEQTIPFWKEMTSHDDTIVSLWSHAALYNLNQDKEYNLKQIGAILRKTNKQSVRKAGREISKLLGDKRCVPILQEYLRSDRGPTVKSVEPAPRTSSSSGHNEERQEAFKLMVELGGKEVLDDIKRIFLEDRDGYLRRDAADYLISLAGQDAVPLLLQGLQDPSPGVRYHICEVIWIADGKDVIAALNKVAAEDPYTDKDEGYEVREEAKAALKKIELKTSGNVQERLIQEARNTQSKLRYWAIERLGEIKDDPAVVEVLKELLKDNVKSSCCQHYHIREAAAEALRKLGKKVIDKGDNVFELQ